MSQPIPFDFECHDVTIRINAGTAELEDEVRQQVASLIPNVRSTTREGDFAAIFDLRRDPDGTTTALSSGEIFASQPVKEDFYRVFSTFLRMTIAELSPDQLFVHAGAVSWKGSGLIFPGDSFVGKSTLVAELVKLGAEYYSDDYAVFDKNGLLHPFPREISMRANDGKYTRYSISPTDLGEKGDKPVPVRMIWFTRFKKDAGWRPETISAGQGVMELMQYTFAFVDRPNFSLPILNKVVSDAIIISGERGSADFFAKTFLEFVDKAVD